VIDERYNQGGMVADYIVNELNRPLMGYFARRDGKPSPSPMVGIYGPKVMIINESAGSGGDALPYYFKQQKLGPLVGTRTWGALVGTLNIPATIDGGGITAPSLAFFDVNGRWAIENGDRSTSRSRSRRPTPPRDAIRSSSARCGKR
jgi:tricorn protease